MITISKFLIVVSLLLGEGQRLDPTGEGQP